MSATNRGSKRVESDFYATPIPTIKKLIDNHSFQDGFVLEPCAGNGNIIKTIMNKYWAWGCTSVEIREEERNKLMEYSDRVYIEDFLNWKPDKEYSTIITNPPFSIAQEIVEHCFEIASPDTEIIMLLRLAFLESKKRYDFWQEHPVNKLYVLSERPSFSNNGKTDATAYCWMVWNGSNKQEIKVI